MDFQLAAAIIFFILMAIFLVVKRRNIQIQKILFPILYFAMYRTKLGLKAMDRFAKKYRSFLHVLSYVSVAIGFLGMLVIVFSLVHNLWKIITVEDAVSGVALVLPFKVKGGFYVPFFYWIVSIFIIAVVHEFSHGIYARFHGMEIKSSGFAFLNIIVPVLPAAFVEPDEEQLQKASRKKQLDVYSAGPFSNVLFGFLFLGLLLLFSGPVSDSVLELSGVEVTAVTSDEPAETAGMREGMIITGVGEKEVVTVMDFIDALNTTEPGDNIRIHTEGNSYDVELAQNPEDENKSLLGVAVGQNSDISSDFFGGKILGMLILWLMGLLYWLFILNVGIGLFNLAPLGPIDGGRMLLVTLEKYFSKERARMIWKNVSFAFLLLIIVNIAASFI